LNVSSVRGALVRAKISSDGDITLTNIGSTAVSAENGIGNIVYDGDVVRGGTYWFWSMQGDISLRIPFNASVKLVATAPSTRRIFLNDFGSGALRGFGDGRRIYGQTGDGASALSVTNQRGSISFYPR
ncbi:MAG: hypothetical protein LC730_07280, partial [Acidobacteria bacterium]|nr:hypothetical protein [Acidobacteriota bacterium]